MYKLYSIPGTCSTGINALLRQLGQQVELIDPSKLTDYRNISPTGQVPALDDNGMIITEGAAITLYLLEKHNSDLVNSPKHQKADFLRWLMFNYATQHPAYSKLFSVNSIMAPSAQKNDLLQALADDITSNWAILETRLETNEFIVGQSASIIDYLAAIYASWGAYFPDQHIRLGPNTIALIKRVCADPVFNDAYHSENADYQLGY